MSSQNIPLNNGRQAIINTETSKTFGWNIRTEYDNYVNNSGYNPYTMPAGMLLGRISATNVMVPFKSDANDGSQYVVGILLEDLTLDGGASAQVAVITAGDVFAEKVVFAKPGDGMETVVNGRRMKDHIQSQSAGIKLVFNTTEMSDFDNQ